MANVSPNFLREAVDGRTFDAHQTTWRNFHSLSHYGR